LDSDRPIGQLLPENNQGKRRFRAAARACFDSKPGHAEYPPIGLPP
jgi:hypothetical protein